MKFIKKAVPIICLCIIIVLFFIIRSSNEAGKNEAQNQQSIITAIENEADNGEDSVTNTETNEAREQKKYPFTAFNTGINEYTLYKGESNIVDLGNREYDLSGATVYIKGPITLKGPAKIINGQISIQDTKDVQIDSIETDNVYVTLQNSSNVHIKNSVFQNINDDILGFIVIREKAMDLFIEDNKFSNIVYATSATTYGCGLKFLAIDTDYKNINIINNTFKEIYGPASIWIGGHNTNISELNIEGNKISDTESFGIELYQYDGRLNFQDTYIKSNIISNIGSVRETSNGAGCGGIYNNLNEGHIFVQMNQIKNVLEVGIEGYYESIENNRIEDTGADQANHPIKDSAGIYSSSPKIAGNTVINPGYYGGIHNYTSGVLSGMVISGNIIKNVFDYWQPRHSYEKGDLIVAGDNWYVCTQKGVSGDEPMFDTLTKIDDGTCLWSYKKPLSEAGIHLNAEGGLENITICNNTVTDMKYFNSLSGFINHINIFNNTYTSERLSIENMEFLYGYGNRTIADGIIETENHK